MGIFENIKDGFRKTSTVGKMFIVMGAIVGIFVILTGLCVTAATIGLIMGSFSNNVGGSTNADNGQSYYATVSPTNNGNINNKYIGSEVKSHIGEATQVSYNDLLSNEYVNTNKLVKVSGRIFEGRDYHGPASYCIFMAKPGSNTDTDAEAVYIDYANAYDSSSDAIQEGTWINAYGYVEEPYKSYNSFNRSEELTPMVDAEYIEYDNSY